MTTTTRIQSLAFAPGYANSRMSSLDARIRQERDAAYIVSCTGAPAADATKRASNYARGLVPFLLRGFTPIHLAANVPADGALTRRQYAFIRRLNGSNAQAKDLPATYDSAAERITSYQASVAIDLMLAGQNVNFIG